MLLCKKLIWSMATLKCPKSNSLEYNILFAVWIKQDTFLSYLKNMYDFFNSKIVIKFTCINCIVLYFTLMFADYNKKHIYFITSDSQLAIRM